MEDRFVDDEDEFRSCCADEEELKEREEVVKLGDGDDDAESCVRMLFKGVSISEPGNMGLGFSGIGVIMEGPDKVPVIQMQKKLDFFVAEEVADYLALMDGLSEAIRNNIKRVFAFTDSYILFHQITKDETPKNPLLMALKQRTLEHVENLEHFVLKCVLDVDLECPLRLAQVATGVVNDAKGDESVENCLICCENKLTSMMITLKCVHKFCSRCMKAYVDEKVHSHEVPVKCPIPECRYYISTPEHKLFLPVASYTLLEDALLEPHALAADKFYCPFPDCSVLLDPRSSTNNCVECPVCRKFICVKCGVRWHSSMTCDEFQDAENRRWRRCQMCERMIELTHGCYHITCWCGHEFCYSCGGSEETCECTVLDEENEECMPNSSLHSQEFEEWAWESFGSLTSNMMDAYSDEERSQLALIQRFLAGGGFSLSDHHEPPSPPDSYLDNTIKELHQLPWLERFVSVISDDYYDQYTP